MSSDWYLKDYKKALLHPSRVLGPVTAVMLRNAQAKAALRDTKFLHPSQICKKDWCPRSSWYTIKDGSAPEESVSLQRMNIFAEGNSIHNKWQQWLWDAKIIEGNWECRECGEVWYGISPEVCPECLGQALFYKEVPITNSDYHLLGHADGILNDSHGRAVLEIKSVGIGTLRFEHPELFMRYSKGDISLDGLWKEIKSPFPSHLRQVNLYMFCLGIHDAVVLYEFKANQDVKEFSIKFQPELISHILAGCSTVLTSLQTNTTPMRPLTASLDAAMCKSCPYYKRCWSIDEDQPSDTPTPDKSRPVRIEVRKSTKAKRGGSAHPRVIRHPS